MRFIILILILVLSNSLFAAKIDTVIIFSKAMGKEIPNLVISPNSSSNSSVSYPVVYLLHGAGGSFLDWSSNVAGLSQYCDNNELILVCPDAGFNSWYFDSPVDSSFRYETYITKELITQVDVLYPTIINSKFRAITGLSMGGHGAFYLAIRNQNIFSFAGSMSGGLDIRPFKNNWSLADRLGDFTSNQKNWEINTVTNMVKQLDNSDLELIFDCGKQDFFFEVNNVFHQKLLDNNIPHIYNVNEGSHNWNYWSKAIFTHLTFFTNKFQQQ